MKTMLQTYTVAEICEGFVYNELECRGLYGLNGKLTVQPEYQRHYIYNCQMLCKLHNGAKGKR